MPTPSGCRYYLIIVDDFSRKFWIFLTKTKGQWCSEFLQWKVTWENQMTTKIARVYCDVDKVFTQDAVFKNLQESGAQLLPAAPYEHWMTGLPERGHRTITESAQACRLFAGMPKTAWGEAIMFALHAYNNTWTHGLAFPQTPNEAFHEKKFADARENIRIFGCLALPNISKEQPERSGKLSEHSTPCVYLGPDPHRDKVHRLLTWPQRKVICRYSVAFDEKVFPFRGDLSHNMNSLANYTDYEFPAIEDEDYGPLEVDPSPTRKSTRNREPSNKALENIVNSNVSYAVSDAPLFSSIYATRVKWSAPPEHPMSSSLFVPRNSSEARRCKDHDLWAKAEQKEIQTLRDAALMKLIPPSKQDKDIQVVNCDFRYRLKTDAEGHVIAHKARLVILGHQVNRKKANIEPENCYASVATFASLRIIMAIACQFGWDLDHFDVTGAFLNAKPRRKIYMNQPPGYAHEDKEDWVAELQKCLYGDPEAGNRWQDLVIESMAKFDAKPIDADPNVYMIAKGKNRIYTVVWVDDYFVTGNCKNTPLWSDFIKHCNTFFKLNYLGAASHALGLKVDYDQAQGTLKISCPAQIDQLVLRNNMQNCNPAATPAIPEHYVLPDDESEPGEDMRPLVGSGVHLSRTCRPDLSQPTNALARVSANPRKAHDAPKRRYIRYCKGTRDFGISMQRQQDVQNPVQVFCDSDYAGDHTDRKSTTGIMIQLFGFPVIWSSKKQPCVSLSSCEAEYIALCEAGKSALWLYRFLKELQLQELTEETLLPIPIYKDNQSAIHMARNPLNHGRTKHVDVRYHWIREQVKQGDPAPVQAFRRTDCRSAFQTRLSHRVQEAHVSWLHGQLLVATLRGCVNLTCEGNVAFSEYNSLCIIFMHRFIVYVSLLSLSFPKLSFFSPNSQN